jgi:AcrR family transcriptional regulator
VSAPSIRPEERPDPLDFLFAPTTRGADTEVDAGVDTAAAEPFADSAAPVRALRTRVRAGNAMQRTRTAVLDGARRAIATSGTAITMTQVAAECGIAKATLYNHFRSREALLDAVLVDEVDQLIEAARGLPLADALAAVATRIGLSPVLAGIGSAEPAVLAAIARIDLSAPQWRRAADALRRELAQAHRAGGELVLRWLSSFIVTGLDRAGSASVAAVAADASALVRALPAG